MFGGDWLIPVEVIADRAVASVGSSRRCTAGAGVCAVAGRGLAEAAGRAMRFDEISSVFRECVEAL
jgi:hypothetical protein